MEGEREMPQGDDDPAPEYAAVVSQPSIRDETTENRREPHAPRVRAVDRTGVFVVEPERVDHVKNEKGPHAVVGEALPRLGEEERYQPSRVPEATIGCARSSTNTSVRRPGPRSSSIGTSPTMRSERQYFP